MAIKVKGIQTVISTLRESDRRFKAAAAEELEKGAKEIAVLARRMAPIDRGDLTRSIRALRVRNDSQRTAWRVKVGGIQSGRDVDTYAVRVHELMGLTSGGPGFGGLLRPGKKSQDKARAEGVPVGGGYMARALKALGPTIQKRITEALKQEGKGMMNRSRK